MLAVFNYFCAPGSPLRGWLIIEGRLFVGISVSGGHLRKHYHFFFIGAFLIFFNLWIGNASERDEAKQQRSQWEISCSAERENLGAGQVGVRLWFWEGQPEWTCWNHFCLLTLIRCVWSEDLGLRRLQMELPSMRTCCHSALRECFSSAPWKPLM